LGGGKKSEGTYLFPKEVEQTADDWWNCKLATVTKTGGEEKHGPWMSWYSNGQAQLEGAYEHDVQVGRFTWWHPNGQKAQEGRYDHGKQDGNWTWWFPSGQKSIRGEYAKGNPTGKWTWWKEDGRVVQAADLSHTEGVVVETLTAPDGQSAPHTTTTSPGLGQPVKR
jgi:antitoxin component YwqK of YwqJK toxin-antitoxin module